jgi:hypothetical protein
MLIIMWMNFFKIKSAINWLKNSARIDEHKLVQYPGHVTVVQDGMIPHIIYNCAPNAELIGVKMI